MKHVTCRQIFERYSNIKFHKIRPVGAEQNARDSTLRYTYTAQSIVKKKCHSLCRVTSRLPHSSGTKVTIHTKNYHCIIGPLVGMFLRQFVTLPFVFMENKRKSQLLTKPPDDINNFILIMFSFRIIVSSCAENLPLD